MIFSCFNKSEWNLSHPWWWDQAWGCLNDRLRPYVKARSGSLCLLLEVQHRNNKARLLLYPAQPQWVFTVIECLILPQGQLHKHVDLLQGTASEEISCLTWRSMQRHPKWLSRISLGWPGLLAPVQLQPCLIQNPILSGMFCNSGLYLFFSNSAAPLSSLFHVTERNFCVCFLCWCQGT